MPNHFETSQESAEGSFGWSGDAMATLDQKMVIIHLMIGNSDNRQIVTRKIIETTFYQHNCRCVTVIMLYSNL